MALAMARPWKHPKTGIFWLRKRTPDDLRPAKRSRASALAIPMTPSEFMRRRLPNSESWGNLRSGSRALNEREAHELVAPAYERWVNAHRDNPSDQKIWKSEYFDELWIIMTPRSTRICLLPSKSRRMDEDGYFDLITMEAFCREKADELLSQRGLKVDELSRQRSRRRLARPYSGIAMNHPTTWGRHNCGLPRRPTTP